MEAAAIEQTFFCGNAGCEQAGQNSADCAADTVYGNCAYRVIDFRYLIKKFYCKYDQNAAYDADDGRAQRAYRVTACGDAYSRV